MQTLQELHFFTSVCRSKKHQDNRCSLLFVSSKTIAARRIAWGPLKVIFHVLQTALNTIIVHKLISMHCVAGPWVQVLPVPSGHVERTRISELTSRLCLCACLNSLSTWIGPGSLPFVLDLRFASYAFLNNQMWPVSPTCECLLVSYFVTQSFGIACINVVNHARLLMTNLQGL